MFAVVACSTCHTPWSVELRHDKSTCPRCGKQVTIRKRKRFWEGDDPRAARAAAAELATRIATGGTVTALDADAPLTAEPLRRHDSPVAAAAAKGRAVVNKSQRAEAVVAALVHIEGSARHDDLVSALVQSGLEPERADQELVRMLAMDLIYEPRVGEYQLL